MVLGDNKVVLQQSSASVKDTDDESTYTEHSYASGDVLRAAGVGFKPDDPRLPCLTLRMWIIGVCFCLLGSGLNTLYTFRKPSIMLSQSAIQLLAYPIGKAWEKIVPDWTMNLFGRRVQLNPGPFNHKENMLIYIMANLSFAAKLSADVLTEQRVFYGLDLGWGFEILITFGTLLVGFTFAGLFRSVIVEPQALVWPGVLGNTALNSALHATEKESSNSTWRVSRYAFFLIAFSISFCWYWFPDFIFPAVGYFTFLCWIFPKNPVVNQVFGMESGLGVLPLTFDWSQIAYIGSPLVVPAWAILNITASLVFWVYIISPALYYTNTWFSAYLPIQSTSVYDNLGKTYNVTKVIDKSHGFSFDLSAYEAYSPVYMPITYAISTFGLQFAAVVALPVWLVLEKRHEIASSLSSLHMPSSESWQVWKKSEIESSQHAEEPYAAVPMWWYCLSALLALFLLMFTCEYWPVQLRWYGVLLALAVSAVLFGPLAIVYATTNSKVSIDVLCRIVAGYVFPGKVLANVWFFDIGYITGIKALAFAQDLKLGIYCDIPPRALFTVQAVGIVLSTLSQVSVLNWALGHIKDICTTHAPNGFTCPYSRTHFNTSLIWGAVGPHRFFSLNALYHPLLYFFLIGAVLPVLVYLIKRRWKNVKWLKKVHVPLFLGGLNYLPPASGTNYGSWAIAGLVFGLLVKRRALEWWRKYNFVLSSALDCSVAIAGVIIFFTVFYTGASDRFSWWGTEVYKDTCDWKSCSFLTLRKGEKFGT